MALAEFTGDVGLGRTFMYALASIKVGGQVSISESEPGGATECLKFLHDAPRFAIEAPPEYFVVESGEGVGDGVEIGANGQSVQNEIVADIDDGVDLTRRNLTTECTQESCRANATTENGYHFKNLRGAWVSSSVVSTTPLPTGWPGESSYAIFRLRNGSLEIVNQGGDQRAVRPWASVSKMAVAMAFAVEIDWGMHKITDSFGPRGATLSNLLSHSSGLGLEEGDPMVPIGTKRVYSNVGIDHAVDVVTKGNEPGEWLNDRVFRGLGMLNTRLEGRASSGVVGSTEDLMRMGVAWLRPDGIGIETRNRFVKPFLPDLDGIVPGFGKFSPCPWGLGPEIRGEKHHWMGDWLPSSFGHFGQSGAMLLVNLEEKIGVVATSSEDFGAWAVALWPEWTSAARTLALAS